MEEEINREPNNTGMRAVYVPCPENDLGSSEQFIGNFLGEGGDLNHVVKNKIWIVSDTHFCHRRILEYEAANRPFKDRDEMNEELIRRWNEKVRDTDIVFHLGDFSFGNKNRIKDIVSRLNGRICLLLGNHDREQHYNWKELGFAKFIKHPFLLDNKFVFSHEPLEEIPDGLVNIYGHVHGSKLFNTIDPNRLCACVERWNCAPIEYDYIKGLFKVV
jgi:calcineurin-like phosphoesterase family protein